MFMEGGPSQFELFDPKPALEKYDGEPLPPSMTKDLKLAFIKPTAKVWASPRVFQRYGQSGIEFCETYKELGFRSHVHGAVKLNLEDHLDRKQLRFMGDGAAYNYIAMQEAIDDAGLDQSDITNERTGLIMGSGGPSMKNMVNAVDTLRSRNAKRVGPFVVPKVMSSTNSATLATPFRIHGVNYSISSACSTSAHCIGNSAELIQWIRDAGRTPVERDTIYNVIWEDADALEELSLT